MTIPLAHCKLKACNQLFQPKRKNQEFHTDKCRETWYEENYPAFKKEVVTKTCPTCGTQFDTTCPGKQDYCTPDCRETATLLRRFGMEITGHITSGTCDLCGQQRKILGVHGTNGTGLKVCMMCNAIAKGVDSGLADKYREMTTRHEI